MMHAAIPRRIRLEIARAPDVPTPPPSGGGTRRPPLVQLRTAVRQLERRIGAGGLPTGGFVADGAIGDGCAGGAVSPPSAEPEGPCDAGRHGEIPSVPQEVSPDGPGRHSASGPEESAAPRTDEHGPATSTDGGDSVTLASLVMILRAQQSLWSRLGDTVLLIFAEAVELASPRELGDAFLAPLILRAVRSAAPASELEIAANPAWTPTIERELVHAGVPCAVHPLPNLPLDTAQLTLAGERCSLDVRSHLRMALQLLREDPELPDLLSSPGQIELQAAHRDQSNRAMTPATQLSPCVRGGGTP